MSLGWRRALHGLTARNVRRRIEALAFEDVKGAVSSEYVVLVGTVGLAVAFAIVTIGPRLVQSFERTRNILTSPFP
jgi:Flp pilus assembly pilin Flp